MWLRRFTSLRSAFSTGRSFFRKNPFTSKKYVDHSWKLLTLAFMGTVSSSIVMCLDETEEKEQIQLSELTMQELVQVLHETSSREFVVIVYNKFNKKKNAKAFAQEFKTIIDHCKKSGVKTIYTITSKDANYLKEITRRLKGQPVQGDQETFQKTFECYFKSQTFSETFELLNSKDYQIYEQIEEIRHFEIQTNRVDLVKDISNLMQGQYAYPKNIVVKQCAGEGECVQFFRKEVKKLLDEGMLTNKSSEYQFDLVVDHPSGILSKSTDYFKDFNNAMLKAGVKGKKEEIYYFRQDILGRQAIVWSQWLKIVKTVGLNYDEEQRPLMFLRPRVNIISKYSMFTDLLWYLRTSRINNSLSISINNTPQWKKINSLETLKVIKLLNQQFPQLNYLIINAKGAGELIHHVHADHKYVIFEQGRQKVWKKKFLNLDILEKLTNQIDRQELFQKQFKPEIEAFINNPQVNCLTVLEKQLEINLDKLRQLKERQSSEGKHKKSYIIRVCDERCGRYLKDEVILQLESKLSENLGVYWIDSSTQNVGVLPGDYLLSSGQMHNLTTFLSTNQETRCDQM